MTRGKSVAGRPGAQAELAGPAHAARRRDRSGSAPCSARSRCSGSRRPSGPPRSARPSRGPRPRRRRSPGPPSRRRSPPGWRRSAARLNARAQPPASGTRPSMRLATSGKIASSAKEPRRAGERTLLTRFDAAQLRPGIHVDHRCRQHADLADPVERPRRQPRQAHHGIDDEERKDGHQPQAEQVIRAFLRMPRFTRSVTPAKRASKNSRNR